MYDRIKREFSLKKLGIINDFEGKIKEIISFLDYNFGNLTENRIDSCDWSFYGKSISNNSFGISDKKDKDGFSIADINYKIWNSLIDLGLNETDTKLLTQWYMNEVLNFDIRLVTSGRWIIDPISHFDDIKKSSIKKIKVK